MTQAGQLWAAVVREIPFRWMDGIDFIARSGARNQKKIIEKFEAELKDDEELAWRACPPKTDFTCTNKQDAPYLSADSC